MKRSSSTRRAEAAPNSVQKTVPNKMQSNILDSSIQAIPVKQFLAIFGNGDGVWNN